MGTTVGVIGGGQLARMMIPPAIEMGVGIAVLGETEEASARQAVSRVGDYRDEATVLGFAETVDAITFDHEHVPQEVLRALQARGVAVRPGPDALRFAQDKLAMRRRLHDLGAPQPEWAAVADPRQLQAFLDEHGGQAVLKTPRGGYDGKGVRLVRSGEEGADWFERFDELLVEQRVEFRRELAQLVARRPSGQIAHWPVVETVQRDGVCAEVIAPAPGTEQGRDRVLEIAASIGGVVAERLEVAGVLAVELFETADQRLLVNELAMRPHNSGHWTIEGSATSQFEQHLRAVLDLPLGDTATRAPWTVMTNILGGPQSDPFLERARRAWRAHPEAKIHGYGKQPRPGRKVGHVTVLGEQLDEAVYRARSAAAHFDD